MILFLLSFIFFKTAAFKAHSYVLLLKTAAARGEMIEFFYNSRLIINIITIHIKKE